MLYTKIHTHAHTHTHTHTHKLGKIGKKYRPGIRIRYGTKLYGLGIATWELSQQVLLSSLYYLLWSIIRSPFSVQWTLPQLEHL